MDSADLLLSILTGGVVGMLGQGIRVVVGLRKRSLADGTAQEEPFVIGKLATSLFIGFVAGGLALLGLRGMAGFALDGRTIGELLAAGYAGADFIESFVQKRLPQLDRSGDAPQGASAVS